MKKNTETILLFLFLVTLCQFSLSTYTYSKDIELDELPKNIQQVVFREIGDVPIDDIDREKDDGKIIKVLDYQIILRINLGFR